MKVGNLKITVVPSFLELGMQLAATLVLYFVLRHFLYKPVKEFLEKRSSYIENNIRESENAKESAMQLKDKYEDQLAKAKSEAANIVASARSFGEEIKEKSIKESKEEADKIYQNGIKSLERERQRLMTSINTDIVDMAMLGAEKVLRQSSGLEMDKNLLDDFVANMEASNE